MQDKDGKTCLHLAFVIGGLGVNWDQYKDFAEAVVAVGGEELVKIKDKEGKSCLVSPPPAPFLSLSPISDPALIACDVTCCDRCVLCRERRGADVPVT